MRFRVFHKNVYGYKAIRQKLVNFYENYRRKVCAKAANQQMDAWIDFKHQNQMMFPAFLQKEPLDEQTAEFLNDQMTDRQRTVAEFQWMQRLSQEYQVTFDTDDAHVTDEQEAAGEQESAGEGPMDVDMPFNDDELDSSDDDNEDESCDDHVYYTLRSGKRIKLDSDDTSLQAESKGTVTTRLRRGKKIFSKECIQSIVNMATECNITINQARKCFLISQNTFNGQSYTLEPVKKPAGVPRTKNDYKCYENVIPSESTLWTHRHQFALSKLVTVFIQKGF